MWMSPVTVAVRPAVTNEPSQLIAACSLLVNWCLPLACLLVELLRISWTTGELSFTRGCSLALSVPVPTQVYRVLGSLSVACWLLSVALESLFGALASLLAAIGCFGLLLGRPSVCRIQFRKFIRRYEIPTLWNVNATQ